MSASSSSPTEETKVKPRCPHFGDCGGCRLQDIAYEGQVARKAGILTELMERAGWPSTVVMRPSPEPWYYRNKMEFSFQDVYPAPPEGEDNVLLGLKRIKRWDKVMNLSDCFLLSPEAPKLLEAVHAWALREKLEPYNLHKQIGFLRHLVVREGKNTGERLVNLITTAGDLPAKSFVEAVLSAYPATTVLRGVHEGKADTALAAKLEVLHGPGHFHESVLGKRFRVSPFAFFQTNTRGSELLNRMVKEWLAEIGPKNVLDLYCGGGAISLSLADQCERVMGVEVVESAIEDARYNAELNGIKNVEFVAAKVEDILPGLAAQKIEVDAVVVDPPRSGVHQSVVTALKELAPPWIVYVSCNPKAMAEDVRRLAEAFELAKVEGVDLFPHTDHMEAVALLRCVYY